MTPAIKLLKKEKINFKIHHFEHDTKVTNFGLEAAYKLNFPAKQIFKTLLISLNGEPKNLVVVIIPVETKLNLKQLAIILKVKKAELSDKDIAQKTTGYLVGGISPLGQKKLLPTFVDNSALQFDTILVSGGKRGLDIEIAANDLAKLTKAEFVNVTSI